jgi:hypothetical protein
MNIFKLIKSWATPSEEHLRNEGKLSLETIRRISLPYGWDKEIVRAVYKAVMSKLQR